jgi:hypothetical protein
MDIIKIYNPANTNITEEQLSAMKDLTDEQIAELAKAYPNQPRGNAYLEYYLTGEKAHEQRYPLGTWANLLSLRKLGRKDILPFRFRRQNAPRMMAPVSQPAQRVVDLSQDDLANVEGLKKQEPSVNEEKQENPVLDSQDPEVLAAKEELQKAIDSKAHHMIVKKLQKQVDDLEGTKAGSGA